MIAQKDSIQILDAKNQLKIIGYDKYIVSFKRLLEGSKLPNVLLLSGPKGIGKATFAYHFINYLLSYNEDDSYNLKNFEINPNNKSYKLVCEDIHPNFFLLDNINTEATIKIDQARNLIKFLSKSTYTKDLKIVMIDNVENLNLNSSNALLKALEEPGNNTFFFLIYNNASKILNTIKSRCLEFKFFFNFQERKKIFAEINKSYNLNYDLNNIDESFYYDTPGNLLKYLSILNDSNIDIINDKLSCVYYLIERYKNKQDYELLKFASFFVEQFYSQLSLNNSNNLINYNRNKFKVLDFINNTIKFSLDKKNLLISIHGVLDSETR